MPRVPSISPATGQPTPPEYLHTTACNFVDNAGRSVILRGVNLSGASKAPVGHTSEILDDFWESSEAGGESFVGRPLNLDDGSADIHLARLRGWGFNFLRFPVTWEALEHEGPGKYDDEYIDYTIQVLQKCKDYGFRIFMDPHQDCWSRFSGGSGAPFWTLAACGLNPYSITATQAAILHCEYPLSHDPDPASLPAMVWSTNYGRLLSQTLFTLFFAGRTFAPDCIIDGKNIQDYLQGHYIEAVGRLADRIREYDGGSLYEGCAIVGWDTMNEPFEGLCGWDDLNFNPTKQGSTLKKGTYPTPAQSFRLGMGQAQTVENWTFGALGPARNGTVTIDPKGYKIWAEPLSPEEGEDQQAALEKEVDDHPRRWGELPDGTHPRWGWRRDVQKWPLGTCIWALHGVWDVETGFVLRPDYFRFDPNTGEEVEFITDFFKPHFIAYKERISKSHPEAVWFIQPPVFARPPEIEDDILKGRCAYSTHYYDGLTLLTRHWNWFNADALGLLRGKYSSTLPAVKIGEPAIRKSLQEQLGMLKDDSKILAGPGYPTVIGEIGIPYDMDGKKSYGWTDGGKYKGDYSNQVKALDASLNACDGGNCLNFTVWNFVPDDHTHEWGDGWNMEDLSLWSRADVWEKRRREDGGKKRRRKVKGKESQESMVLGTGEGQPMRSVNSSRLSVATNSDSPKPRSKQLRPSLAMVAAASSLSLATLGAATATLPSDSTSTFESESSTGDNERDRLRLLGWHTNPFDFLSDGARAVKAFARPFPEKTVGTPKYIQFDVNKAIFKCTIAVTAEDKPRIDGLRQRKSTDKVPEDREGEETEVPLGTEIFLPLIHFAHPRLLDSPARRRSKGYRSTVAFSQASLMQSKASLASTSTIATSPITRRSSPRPADSNLAGISEDEVVDGNASPALTDSPVPPSAAPKGSDSVGSVATAVNNHVPAVGVVPILNSNGSPSAPYLSRAVQRPAKPVRTYSAESGVSTLSSLSSGSPGKAKASGMPHPVVPGVEDDGEDLVDVEVKVSEGKWRIEGQRLFWWYDVPPEAESTGNKEAGVKEVTIEVRRRGGVVKNQVAKRREAEAGTWCEQLCEEGLGCRVI